MFRRIYLRIAGIMLISLVTAGISSAQPAATTVIAFDKESKPLDIRTGKPVLAVTHAERGSVRFYLSRLDKPDEFFNFYHDGFRKASIGDLASMEKVQGQFGIWRLRYKNGSKNTPRVQHQAVSFIPVNADGKPGERVYLRLDDLSLIDFRE